MKETGTSPTRPKASRLRNGGVKGVADGLREASKAIGWNFRVIDPRLGVEAVCQDGRRWNGESNRREVRLYQPPEKRPRTKGEEEDEKDSELTLNRDKPWAKLSCLFGAQTSATCRARPRQFVTEQVSTSLAPNEVNAGE